METQTETKHYEMASEEDIEQQGAGPIDGTLRLGGNIELKGFNEVEPAQMVVVKKMVGSYVRKITDTGLTPDVVTIIKSGDKCSINIKAQGKELSSEEKVPNIFFCLDKALAGVLKQV